MPSQDPAPLIVLLTLEKAEFYDELYTDFTNALRRRADVKRVTTPSEARALFNRNPKPAVVLSADESLTVGTRQTLVQEAARYVQSGGILLFMGLFSSFSRPPDIGRLFQNLGLPWTSGDYYRTSFALNPAITLLNTGGMATSYSQKALHLANVAHGNAVYLPCDESRNESAAWPPLPVSGRTQTPTAFASVGAGNVGYVGDVNNERETTTVVLRMCGFVGP